jgi:hypothetical protein
MRQLADLAGILLALVPRRHDGFEPSTASPWSKFAGATTQAPRTQALRTQAPRTRPTESVKLQHLAHTSGAALELSRPRWVPSTRPQKSVTADSGRSPRVS